MKNLNNQPFTARLLTRKLHSLSASQLKEVCDWLRKKANQLEDDILNEKEKYSDNFSASIDLGNE